MGGDEIPNVMNCFNSVNSIEAFLELVWKDDGKLLKEDESIRQRFAEQVLSISKPLDSPHAFREVERLLVISIDIQSRGEEEGGKAICSTLCTALCHVVIFHVLSYGRGSDSFKFDLIENLKPKAIHIITTQAEFLYNAIHGSGGHSASRLLSIMKAFLAIASERYYIIEHHPSEDSIQRFYFAPALIVCDYILQSKSGEDNEAFEEPQREVWTLFARRMFSTGGGSGNSTALPLEVSLCTPLLTNITQEDFDSFVAPALKFKLLADKPSALNTILQMMKVWNLPTYPPRVNLFCHYKEPTNLVTAAISAFLESQGEDGSNINSNLGKEVLLHLLLLASCFKNASILVSSFKVISLCVLEKLQFLDENSAMYESGNCQDLMIVPLLDTFARTYISVSVGADEHATIAIRKEEFETSSIVLSVLNRFRKQTEKQLTILTDSSMVMESLDLAVDSWYDITQRCNMDMTSAQPLLEKNADESALRKSQSEPTFTDTEVPVVSDVHEHQYDSVPTVSSTNEVSLFVVPEEHSVDGFRSELPVAYPVEPDSNYNHSHSLEAVYAEPVILSKNPESSLPRRRTYIIMMIFVTVIIGVIIGITVPLTKNKKSVQGEGRAESILRKLKNVSGTSVNDTNQPQGKAASWLLYDDERKIESTDSQLIQRYALAVLYFATGGDDYWTFCSRRRSDNSGNNSCIFRSYTGEDFDSFENKTTSSYLSKDHECLWMGSTCLSEEGEIRNLSIPFNNLTGTLPPELSQLRILREIDFRVNNLRGTMPSFESLVSLESINLQNNYFTGRIPEQLFTLTKLKSVNLGANNFSGTLSENCGKLLSLKSLILYQNNLTGTLPKSMMALNGLSQLLLSKSSLHGTIPSWLGELKALRELRLDLNRFSGTIPTSVTKLIHLETLHLSLNALSGTLPSEIGKLENLYDLRLSNNNFFGPLNDQLGYLKELLTLDLKLNNFGGSIPSSLGQLENLSE